MIEDKNPKDINKLAEEASRWIISPEGKKAVREAFQNAAETSVRLEEAQKIKPDTLLEPVTL